MEYNIFEWCLENFRSSKSFLNLEFIKILGFNASIEQVRSMAKLYGVDKKVEELLKNLDEQER